MKKHAFCFEKKTYLYLDKQTNYSRRPILRNILPFIHYAGSWHELANQNRFKDLEMVSKMAAQN